MKLKHKEKLELAFNTLEHTWGGDTPAEATWAANEFIDWLVAETGINFIERFREAYNDSDSTCPSLHNERVLKELLKAL